MHAVPDLRLALLLAASHRIAARRQARDRRRQARLENPVLLPLAVDGGLARRLTFLGQDLCDYNAPLLARDFAARTDGFTARCGRPSAA
jgi:CelD/BcsL family acetyltransferase involved in cellulose biosynthesis